MDKQALRAEIRAKKRAMTPAQIEAASGRLAELLFAHPAYQAAKSLYGYLSYNQEVRTAKILQQAQKDGKRVAVPKVFGDEMRFLWLDDLSAVAPALTTSRSPWPTRLWLMMRPRSCSCPASPLTRTGTAAATAAGFTTSTSPRTGSM